MSDTSPLLDVQGVRASYGRFEVLRDVTLSVGRGEVVALVGANGAGKSTVLKAIAGLLRPTAGTVRLNGQDITGLRPHVVLRAGCAYVAQGQDLFPQMTVAENVEMGGYILRDVAQRRRRRDACMDRFPVLAEKAGVRAEGLSGGERQQLKLARALMTEPALLLLDEPSAGLAPLHVDRVFDDLRALLGASGVGALVVEQNVAKAIEIADTVCVLDLGRVVLHGTRDELSSTDAIHQVFLGRRHLPVQGG